MVTVIERKLGHTGRGPGVNHLIRLPDPDKSRPSVQPGTRPAPNK